jgi:lysophospholipase L1-like esterase
MRFAILCCCIVLFSSQNATAWSPRVELSPAVVTAMQKVHAGFKGQAGYVAQFGDSITYSMAFWSPIGWDEPQKYLTEDDGLPKTPTNTRWRDYVKGTRDKGPKFANYSGWRVGQLLKAMDAALQRDKPEMAIIMIGTNDISGGSVPESYRANLEQVIRKCTEAHCVPILNTIPPRRGRDKAVDDANTIIRDMAKSMNVPLVDFHAECLRVRPGDSWDGTIISKDGVHPSGGKSNVYTPENMVNCGYALRNWLNFLAIRQVYFRVLKPH